MNYYQPTDKRILILGRTVRKNPMPLFWTASGLEFSTESSEVWFDIETDYALHEEWLRIEVDGFCMQRMLLPKGRSKICAFRALPADAVRTVRLLKEVQPMREDEERCLLVYGVECDGELLELPKKSCRLEFVGDSLSSGEGLGGSPLLMNTGSAKYGLTGHYALKIAEHFNADFRILSQSGWGVYCSCYNDLIHIMPKYYEQVCGVVTGEKNRQLGAFEENAFEEWQPDAVIINLASNDGFALDREAWLNPQDGREYRQVTNAYGGVEEQSALRFEQAVTDFLQKVRRCNPEAYILWAYGMCDHTMLPYLQRAIAQYRKQSGDMRMELQILPTTTALWTGSSGHPGVVNHGYAADVIIDKLENIL